MVLGLIFMVLINYLFLPIFGNETKCCFEPFFLCGVWNGFLLSKVKKEDVPCRFCGAPDNDGHLFWDCTFPPFVELRNQPEFLPLMSRDRTHWPRCLLWHGWLPGLSPRTLGTPWACCVQKRKIGGIGNNTTEDEREERKRERERRKERGERERERENGGKREERERPSVCAFNTSPCVRSKCPRVYRQHAHMKKNMWACCRHTRGHFERTHGDVLNAHTEVFSVPHHNKHRHHTQPHTPHTTTNTHTTHQHTTQHTNTHTHQHTIAHTNTDHPTREREREQKRRREKTEDRRQKRTEDRRGQKTEENRREEEKKTEDRRQKRTEDRRGQKTEENRREAEKKTEDRRQKRTEDRRGQKDRRQETDEDERKDQKIKR